MSDRVIKKFFCVIFGILLSFAASAQASAEKGGSDEGFKEISFSEEETPQGPYALHLPSAAFVARVDVPKKVPVEFSVDALPRVECDYYSDLHRFKHDIAPYRQSDFQENLMTSRIRGRLLGKCKIFVPVHPNGEIGACNRSQVTVKGPLNKRHPKLIAQDEATLSVPDKVNCHIIDFEASKLATLAVATVVARSFFGDPSGNSAKVSGSARLTIGDLTAKNPFTVEVEDEATAFVGVNEVDELTLLNKRRDGKGIHVKNLERVNNLKKLFYPPQD